MADEHDRDDADAAELRALIERTRPQDVEWEAPPEELWERDLARHRAPGRENGSRRSAGGAARDGSSSSPRPLPPRSWWP